MEPQVVRQPFMFVAKFVVVFVIVFVMLAGVRKARGEYAAI
jgi:hypothetical protein